MKALDISQATAFRHLEPTMPQLIDDDSVIVQVKCVGISASGMRNDLSGNDRPMVPGCEIVGVVREKGSHVTELRTGDHVALDPFADHEHRNAHTMAKPDAREESTHCDGATCAYIQYDQHHWNRIPKAIPFHFATLIEAYAKGADMVYAGDVDSGDVVLIRGADIAGFMALSLSKKLGATCILSDVDDSRLEGARGWDVDVTLNALHGDFHECMMALTGGEGPNVILDIGDSAQRMAENVQLISQAGRIVCGNDGSGEACYSMPVLSRKEAVITGPRMRQGHLSAVIERFHADLDTLRPIAFLHFPLDLAEQAFALAGTAPNAAKVVVDFD